MSLVCLIVISISGCESKTAPATTTATTTTVTETTSVTTQPTTINQIVRDVTVDEAYNLITENINNPQFVILDVRTTEEYNQVHIEGAVLIDILPDTWQAEIEALDKHAKYLVYCAIGGRSASAVELMQLLNFEEVYNMIGGISAWITAGYPVIIP